MPLLRHLVVVLPGIGGSVLADDQGIAWDTTAAQFIGTFADPARLEAARPMRPLGLIGDFALLPGWALVQGYGDLVSRIHHRFDNFLLDDGNPERPVEDANVLLFPYDFRRSIADTAAILDRVVRARVRRLFGREDHRRVLVVAHSLGGLVARYWLGPLGAWPLCRAVLTMGTPHRGAPKALDWLVNGIDGGMLRFRGAARVIREWPAALELLPRYPAILDQRTARPAYPYQLAGELGLGAAAARDAFERHVEIEQAWAKVPPGPEGPEVVPLVGSGHPTLESAHWNGTALVVSKDRPDWLYESDLRGDGTVPAISAVPIELSNQPAAWRESPLRHLPLASSEVIVQLLVQYSTGGFAAVRGAAPPEQRPQVCLDLEECYVSGSIPVVASVRPARVDTSRARLWVEVEAHGSKRLLRVEMQRAGESWHTELAGLQSGLHDVRVAASGVRPEPIPAQDTFAVVAP